MPLLCSFHSLFGERPSHVSVSVCAVFCADERVNLTREVYLLASQSLCSFSMYLTYLCPMLLVAVSVEPVSDLFSSLDHCVPVTVT